MDQDMCTVTHSSDVHHASNYQLSSCCFHSDIHESRHLCTLLCTWLSDEIHLRMNTSYHLKRWQHEKWHLLTMHWKQSETFLNIHQHTTRVAVVSSIAACS